MKASNYKTEQEKFWAGEFGDEYTDRNEGSNWVATNVSLFSKILSSVKKPNSILELGCNQGLNLRALKTLLPNAKLEGVEINVKAAEMLKEVYGIDVHTQSLFDFKTDTPYDFVFIKGVLIHLNPDMLSEAYRVMYESSSRYIMLAEYYNPTPVAIPYRGHSDRLFKPDFAGEMLDQYPDLNLVDYGFVYHRDNNFPQDDITWFLMEKKR